MNVKAAPGSGTDPVIIDIASVHNLSLNGFVDLDGSWTGEGTPRRVEREAVRIWRCRYCPYHAADQYQSGPSHSDQPNIDRTNAHEPVLRSHGLFLQRFF